MTRKLPHKSDFCLNVREIVHAGPVAGVDEAGRGPLAGPVVAAAVILHPDRTIAGLADSKKLTPERREELAPVIRQLACVGIGIAEPAEIDRINILHATMAAMARAVGNLSIRPGYALIDGNRIPEGLPCPAEALIKGDAREPAISAASIIAKTVRDAIMRDAARRFPEYGFEGHKGYPCPSHRALLAERGACAIHRRSYAPVRAVRESRRCIDAGDCG